MLPKLKEEASCEFLKCSILLVIRKIKVTTKNYLEVHFIPFKMIFVKKQMMPELVHRETLSQNNSNDKQQKVKEGKEKNKSVFEV